MTINSIQDQIIDEFAILGDDRESTIFYIMELGAKLPAMAGNTKTEQHRKGCNLKSVD